MASQSQPLPAITVIIEWENAIDVEDDWTAKAMQALEREMREVAPRMPQKPRIMYLYDRNEVASGTVEQVVDQVAPQLKDVADLEIIPTEGLTYYKLKNYGIARSTTELSVMLDSDAGPEPGWLDALLNPFSDPEVMAVGGFTVLGHESLLDKAMALSWVFNLPGEKAKTERRAKIHVNNCAVRTEFFRANPFPDLPAFKKQCVFWLNGIRQKGYKYVRTADAMAIHAPHPGWRFLAWRAWTGGFDSDFAGYHRSSKNRASRLLFAFTHFVRKTFRSWKNIVLKGKAVDLPLWQRPFAMVIALAFYLVMLAGQLASVASRSFGPLPDTRPLEPIAG